MGCLTAAVVLTKVSLNRARVRELSETHQTLVSAEFCRGVSFAVHLIFDIIDVDAELVLQRSTITPAD